MKLITPRYGLVLAFGFALGVGFMYATPSASVNASAAVGNDRFSMTTVPIERVANNEAVFILDHLTGILRGGVLNSQNAKFTHTYLRNIAADFQLNPATPEPKYSIIGGPVNLRSSGGNQPANGVLYVAELTSGAVAAYGFAIPRGRGSAEPRELVRLDAFAFREAAGG